MPDRDRKWSPYDVHARPVADPTNPSDEERRAERLRDREDSFNEAGLRRDKANPSDEELIERARDYPTITRMSHGSQIDLLQQMREALKRHAAGRVSAPPTPEHVYRYLLGHNRAETLEWLITLITKGTDK